MNFDSCEIFISKCRQKIHKVSQLSLTRMHRNSINWPHPFWAALPINHFKFTKIKTQKRRSCWAICFRIKLDYSFSTAKSMRRSQRLVRNAYEEGINLSSTSSRDSDERAEKTRKKARVLDIDGRNFAKRNCKWIIEKKKWSYGWEKSILNVTSWRCALAKRFT